MTQQKAKIIRNSALLASTFAKTFCTTEDIYEDVLEAEEGLVINDAYLDQVEEEFQKALDESGVTGSFYTHPWSNTTGVISIGKVPLKSSDDTTYIAMYNPAYLANMDVENIRAFWNYAIQVMLEVKSVDRREGLYEYKGEMVTFKMIENINTPIEECSPWRQDFLKGQCEEIGIELTNDLAKLTGIESNTFSHIFKECEKRMAAEQSAKEKLRAK